MKYFAFVLAATIVFGLAVFDRSPARGDQAQAAARVPHDTPYRPLHVLTLANAPVADAAPAVIEPPEIDPTKTAVQAFDAFKAGRYFVGVSLLILIGVWALRKWGGAWARTDRGGALLALLAGQAAAFSTLAGSGAGINGGAILDAVLAGLVLTFGAAGTRHVMVNAAAPPDKRQYVARPGALR